MRSFISKSFPVPGNNTKIPLFYKRYIELRTKKLTTIFQDLTGYKKKIAQRLSDEEKE